MLQHPKKFFLILACSGIMILGAAIGSTMCHRPKRHTPTSSFISEDIFYGLGVEDEHAARILQGKFDFEAWIARDPNPLTEITRKIKIITIETHISGILSFIASSILAWHILRSHERLSTTFNRLLFGLCVADIMASFAYALGSVMTPKDVNYWIWNARGNAGTCDAQGFFWQVGMISSLLYNCSLCIHSFAIINYGKSDDYIRNRVEPWLHGATLYPLIGGVIMLVRQNFNLCGSYCCASQYTPFHCFGYESGSVPDGYNVPCGRGDKPILSSPYPLTFYVFTLPIILVSPIIISVLMALMYRSVRKIELKTSKYGLGSLRMDSLRKMIPRNTKEPGTSKRGEIRSNLMENVDRNETQRPVREGVAGEAGGEKFKLKKKVSFLAAGKKESNQRTVTTSISMRASSKSRAVLRRALFYAIAYFTTYLAFLVRYIWGLVPGPNPPMALSYIEVLFIPLQGLFNFCIYMYPRVLQAKRPNKRTGEGHRTWRKAFMIALLSRGKLRTDRDLQTKSLKRTMSSLRQSVMSSLRIVGGKNEIPKNAREEHEIVTNAIGEENIVLDCASPSKLHASSNRDRE